MIESRTLALYTTVYPGVEPFLAPWFESVKNQTDENFDLWIGVDALGISAVIESLGTDPGAHWVLSEPGDSPARIREKAIGQIIEQYPAVIFVDSDDLLDSTRVEAARKMLQTCDLAGCSMRLIDEDGNDIGVRFEAPLEANWDDLLIRSNAFGLTNSAYRSETLKASLPLPEECELVDWYFATTVMLQGARIGFDPECRMFYRQYRANMAPVVPPFSSDQLTDATNRVLRHYELILKYISGTDGRRGSKVETAKLFVERFYKAVINSNEIRDRYLKALNKRKTQTLWWSQVADPTLEELWN